MLKYLFPAAILALAPLAATAKVETSATYLQTEFEVSGVSLGMQPEEAFAALEERGFKMPPLDSRHDIERGPSFDELVKIASGEMSKSAAKSAWKSVIFRKGAEQAVELKFKPLPTGNAVSTVVYGSYTPGMTWERFQSAVETKYGKPRHADKRLHRWSDLPLKGSQVNIAEGAISLEAFDGGSNAGLQDSQREIVTLTLFRGKISLVDPKELAKDWTPVPKSDF